MGDTRPERILIVENFLFFMTRPFFGDASISILDYI
jgi:hypothetical protein